MNLVLFWQWTFIDLNLQRLSNFIATMLQNISSGEKKQEAAHLFLGKKQIARTLSSLLGQRARPAHKISKTKDMAVIRKNKQSLAS